MADWLGIDSSNLIADCGDNGTNTIEEALNGTDVWIHSTNHNHEFTVDLGLIYNIQRVRGRSDTISRYSSPFILQSLRYLSATSWRIFLLA